MKLLFRKHQTQIDRAHGGDTYLTAQGEDCVVVNPSSMPKRSGDRIKTDRRDGDALALLHRAGELTAIYIPTPPFSFP